METASAVVGYGEGAPILPATGEMQASAMEVDIRDVEPVPIEPVGDVGSLVLSILVGGRVAEVHPNRVKILVHPRLQVTPETIKKGVGLLTA